MRLRTAVLDPSFSVFTVVCFVVVVISRPTVAILLQQTGFTKLHTCNLEAVSINSEIESVCLLHAPGRSDLTDSRTVFTSTKKGATPIIDAAK